MASAGRNLMNANSAARDSSLFDDRKSLWLPEGWDVSANWHGEWKDIDANVVSGLGGKTVFQIQDTLMDYAGAFVLKFTKPAWVAGGGAIDRMVDFAGYQFIDNVQITYGSNFVRSFTGYELQTYHHRMLKDRDEQDAANELVRGDKSDAERAADYLASVTYYVDIPFWITDTRKAIPISVLSHEMNITIQWNTLANLVFSDGAPTTPSPAITDQKMRIYFVHVPSDEQAFLQTQSDTGNGLLYLINDLSSDAVKEVTIPSGSTTFTHRLTNYKSPVVEHIVTIRKASNVNSTTFGNDPFLREQIATITIQGSGLDIVPALEHDFLINKIFPLYHSGPPGEYIYVIPHSANPEDARDHYGSLNYFNISNPTMVLTFPAGLSEDHILDIQPVVKNLVQFKSGDMKKVYV